MAYETGDDMNKAFERGAENAKKPESRRALFAMMEEALKAETPEQVTAGKAAAERNNQRDRELGRNEYGRLHGGGNSSNADGLQPREPAGTPAGGQFASKHGWTGF